MNETLKKVYGLLEVKCEPVKHKGGDWFLLTHQGKKFGNYCSSEELAWMMAPSLESLMPHLWYVMAKPYVVSTQLLANDIWHAELGERHSGAIPDGCFAIGSSLAIAIGQLFFLACKAELIDPKTVVLP